MSRILVVVLASVSLQLASAAEPSSKPSSTPPQAPAFDLTWFPKPGSSGFVAFRPSALADCIPASADEVHQLMSYVLVMMGGQVKAAELPVASDLEQAILKLDLHTSYDRFVQPGGHPHSISLHSSGGTVRALKPFDWSGRIARWFPNSEEVKHAGRVYLRVPVTIKETKATLAIFIPDDRTVCIDDEDTIRVMLTNLKEKKPLPTKPEGWDAVSRDLIALSVDLKSKTALSGLRESHETKRFTPFLRLEDEVESFLLGVQTGKETTIRATLKGRKSGAGAEKAVKGLRALILTSAKESLASEDQAFPPLLNWVITATQAAEIKTTDKTVSIRMTAPGDVHKMLQSLLSRTEY